MSDVLVARTKERLSGEGTMGPEAYYTYMRLEPGFGEPKPSTLLELGNGMRSTKLPHVLRAAAAATREAVLFYPERTDASVDHITDNGNRGGDLALLDQAQDDLREGVEQGWTQLDRGVLGRSQQITVLHAWLELKFGDTYKDLVCGENTQRTREELRAGLHKVGNYLGKMPDDEQGLNKGALARLGTKLLLMLGCLQETDDSLLLPAPVRSANRTRKKVPKNEDEDSGAKHIKPIIRRAFDAIVVSRGPNGYQPVAQICISGIKNVYDKPDKIIVIGTATQLHINLLTMKQVLKDLSNPRKSSGVLTTAWTAVATSLLERPAASAPAFPHISTPAYTHWPSPARYQT